MVDRNQLTESKFSEIAHGKNLVEYKFLRLLCVRNAEKYYVHYN